MSMEPAILLDEAIAYAALAFDRRMLVESAGLFWIYAELLILFGVLLGRRWLSEAGRDKPVSGRRSLPWQAAGLGLGAVLMSVFTLSRHAFLTPVHHYLSAYVGTGRLPSKEALEAIYLQRELEHLALWILFVSIWVLLEIAIVYQGWRGYRDLSRRLAAPVASRRQIAPILLLVASLLGLSLSAQAGAILREDQLIGAMQAAQEEALVYRNAMYLYLRLAGVIWIAVEWIAAILLLRAWPLARRLVAAHGGGTS